ncbi:GNAT family N-acetyltransferase [Streptomyces sp. H10-C2]|uniref:GNAT family N-acetyltransferase n=1 Tax=unclassified Streptomyces TaxID=2593676 RepID=UPI0024BBB160|nr:MULTISPECIES: GNAT family N-acetyltransferase [unclassified Streptomyces]MDJ0340855.1 GNAT family N-acetyltransferase [Streptomyces sp. PH10-H1]MDJ0371695.1 GNAT family N-acetyltransferase [Streptomyces sp. H10-C2]
MTEIRVMTGGDIEAVSAIRVHGWQRAYAGIVPQPCLDAMTVAADAARRRAWFENDTGRVENLVSADGAEVTGWASHGPYRGEDAEPGDGELYAIYVRPDLIGTGAGRALVGAVLTRAADRGFRRVRLWVLADNAPARRFYEKAGFVRDGAEQLEDYDEVSLREVRYVRGTPPSSPASW